jgi:23S rRNA pseudouridine1911/1915/1917 synthase
VVVAHHAPPERAASEATHASAPHTVVFEDEHLIVVDKPAGVVVHPGSGQAHGTLVQALAGRTAGGPPERPGIVHRLDRDTSGLLVVARSEGVHAALCEALRRREVRREYVALVEGVPDARSATIDAPVGRDRGDRTLISTASDRPRSARTHFEVREALAHTALLALRLETGRTHQIRAHLAAIEHPVCGDPRYGGRRSGARLGLQRQFLHSARLGFVHPVTGEELGYESELPGDLEAVLDRARAESPPAGRRGD